MARSPENLIFEEVRREIDRGLPGPLYLQIAHRLVERIERGELIAGQPLPRQRQFCKLLGVGEVTIRRALAHLQEQGWVRARQGSGTVVTTPTLPGDRRRRPPINPGADRVGIVLMGSTDGYPLIQPLLQHLTIAGRHRATASPMWETFYVPADPRDRPDPALVVPFDALDAVVMMSPACVPLIAACHRAATPCVLAFNDLADDASRCVVVEYGAAVLDAVTDQRQRGKSRFALITSQRDRFSTGRLTAAFEVALQANGLELDLGRVVPAGYHQQQGYAATRSLLATNDPPDAILVAAEQQATGALRAIVEAGLRPHEDVALVAVTERAEGVDAIGRIHLSIDDLADALHAAIGAVDEADPPRLHRVACRYLPHA